jgi:CubicO group peptidase (beta-lactamase class C family)
MSAMDLKTWLAITLVLFLGYRGAKAAVWHLKDDPAANAAEHIAQAPAGLDDLGSMLEEIRAKHKLPAIGGAIVRGNKLVAIGAAGVRKAGGTTPVTVDDQWHVGSCTKAITATLIGRLVEEGKLSWDAEVGEFFRARGVEVDRGWDKATLRQLLDHRGGVPADLNKDGLWRKLWEFKGTARKSRMELVRGVLSKPPAHDPGTTYEYANAGFAIAGAMAEEATDQTWEDLMGERIFTPLGMTACGFGPPGMAGAEEQPWGHGAKGQPREPGPGADNPPAIGPGGTAHMTLSDWAKFVAAHLRGERAGALLLKPETYVLLHTPDPGPGAKYGGGWGIDTRDWAKGEGGTGRVLTHSGSNTMWFAVTWIAPERDFAVLVTCNQGGDAAAKACDQAAWALIQRALKGSKTATKAASGG